jgi:hypothetical protein
MVRRLACGGGVQVPGATDLGLAEARADAGCVRRGGWRDDRRGWAREGRG